MSLELFLYDLGMYSAQAAALVGAASALVWMSRLQSPRALVAFRQCILAVCLLLPLLQSWRTPLIDGGVEITQSAAVPIATTASNGFHLPWTIAIAGILAAGVVVRLLWLLAGICRLAIYRKNARRLEELAEAEIYLSEDVSGPVTFGWLRPAILLPSTFPAMGAEMRDAILRHELAHIARNDWLFTLFEEFIRAILWFHPAIWWLLAQIHLAREQAVDQAVVEQTASRERYIEALLAMAGVATEQNVAPAPLFMKKRQLARRVAMLVKENAMSKNRVRLTLAAMAALLVPGARFGMMLFPLEAPAQEVKRGGENLLHRSPVEYPADAIENKIEGTVVVEARLDEKGIVRDARVISGPDALRAAALKSVLDWHYSIEKGAPPIVEIAIDFKLPKGRIVFKPAAGTIGILQSFDVQGVSAELKEKILARVSLKVGDSVSDESFRSIEQTVKGVDEHLRVMRLQMRENNIRIIVTMSAMNSAAPGGVIGGIIGSVGETAPRPAAPGQIRVGGNVQSANLIQQPRPAYPPLAKQARIQGTVRFQVVIAKDGTVKNMQLDSGHPLLAPSAREAVVQWVYRPTLLNGEPVEVLTTVDVNFTLSDGPPPTQTQQ